MALKYDSRKIDPKTFDPEGKDLRKLVGFCSYCDKSIRGKEAIPHSDPYDSEIDGDYTLVVQCKTCEKFSGEEI